MTTQPAASLLAAMSDNEVATRLVEVFAAEQKLAAQRLTLIAEADGRGLPRRDGATSTVAWLRGKLRISGGYAKSMVSLARALARGLISLGLHDTVDPPEASDFADAQTVTGPETEEPTVATARALMLGLINTEQAAVAARVLAELSSDVDDDVRAQAERVLLRYAMQFEPGDLAILGSRVLEHVAPDLAQEQERRRLERQEARARRERGFTLTPDGFGLVRLRGALDAESAATVTAAIEPLCAPSRSGAGGASGAKDDATADPAEVKPVDERTAAQKRADALVEICRLALACGELPDHGGEPPQLIVTMQYRDAEQWLRKHFTKDQAAAGDPSAAEATADSAAEATADSAAAATADSAAAAARPERSEGPERSEQSRQEPERSTQGPVGRLDNGETVSPETVRRIACNAGIIPAVLGGDGQVLDVGRMRRLVSGSIRKALIVRDRGCSFPCCDRPPRWTQGHHIQHWLDGGVTSLDNTALLCHWHHRLVHEGDWQVRLGSDQMPEFIPPSYVDPLRRPRRNQYHRRC